MHQANTNREGACSICGEPLAAHYDTRNAWIGCMGARVASGRWQRCGGCGGNGRQHGRVGSYACGNCGGVGVTMVWQPRPAAVRG